MLLALLITLICFYLFVYNVTKDVLHPTLLMISGYILGSGFAYYAKNVWCQDISYVTFIVIILSIFSFFSGNIFAFGIYYTKLRYYSLHPGKYRFFRPIQIKKIVFILLIFFQLVVLKAYYDFILNLSEIGGNDQGIFGVLAYARLVMYNDNFIKPEMGLFLQYGILLSKAIAYFSFFAYIYNKSLAKTDRLLLVPVLVYFFITVLSTGRTQMMYLILFAFIIYMKLYSYRNPKSATKFILKRGVFTFLIIISFFLAIGIFFRSAVYGAHDPLELLSKYIGSPIIALDNFLQTEYRSKFLGEETLYSVYSMLNKFGFDFEIPHTELSFTSWTNCSTNIYTALRRYIHDYGLGGNLLIQFILGNLYGVFYYSLLNKNSSRLVLIVYALILYPVIFSFIEERFIINVMSTSGILLIVTMCLMYRIFKRNTYVEKKFC